MPTEEFNVRPFRETYACYAYRKGTWKIIVLSFIGFLLFTFFTVMGFMLKEQGGLAFGIAFLIIDLVFFLIVMVGFIGINKIKEDNERFYKERKYHRGEIIKAKRSSREGRNYLCLIEGKEKELNFTPSPREKLIEGDTLLYRYRNEEKKKGIEVLDFIKQESSL